MIFFFSERTEQLLLKGFKRVLHVEVGTQGLEQGCAPDYTPQPTLFYNEQHREPGLQARDCPTSLPRATVHPAVQEACSVARPAWATECDQSPGSRKEGTGDKACVVILGQTPLYREFEV